MKKNERRTATNITKTAMNEQPQPKSQKQQ